MLAHPFFRQGNWGLETWHNLSVMLRITLLVRRNSSWALHDFKSLWALTPCIGVIIGSWQAGASVIQMMETSVGKKYQAQFQPEPVAQRGFEPNSKGSFLPFLLLNHLLLFCSCLTWRKSLYSYHIKIASRLAKRNWQFLKCDVWIFF